MCYPESYKFKSQATKWGCDHEIIALKNYCRNSMKISQLMNVVFFISLTVLYIGASPDALVSCNCCGNSCLEIKSPFDSREKFVFEILDCDDSYLEEMLKTESSKNHPYVILSNTVSGTCYRQKVL